MVQVWEINETMGKHELGAGQQLEEEMAALVGIKVFRIDEPEGKFKDGREEVKALAREVDAWFAQKQRGTDDCNAQKSLAAASTAMLGDGLSLQTPRTRSYAPASPSIRALGNSPSLKRSSRSYLG